MKKVVVSGVYRSGTSYFQKYLDNHKSCEIVHQPISLFTRYLEKKIFKSLNIKINKNYPLGLKLLNPKNLDLSKIYLEKKRLIDILLKIKIKKKNDKIFKHINKSFFLKFLKILNKKKNINFEEFLDLLFLTIFEYRDKKKNLNYLGFKENYITSLFPYLLKVKKLILINIVRDPREILISRNYPTNKNVDSAIRNSRHPVIMIALMWKINVLMSVKLKKFKNFYLLKFEDMINKKIFSQLRLFKKLKLKRNIKNLFDKDNNLSWEVNSNHNSKNFSKKFYNLIKLNDALSKDVAIIESICKREMRIMNYDLYFNDKKRLSLIKNFSENKKKLLNWTQQKIFLNYGEYSKKIIKQLSK